MVHKGDLYIRTAADAAKYAGVVHVTGALVIQAKGASLPVLKGVEALDVKAVK